MTTTSNESFSVLVWRELVAMVKPGWQRLHRRRTLLAVILCPLLVSVAITILLALAAEPVPVRVISRVGLFLYVFLIDVTIWLFLLYAPFIKFLKDREQPPAGYVEGAAYVTALMCMILAGPLSLTLLSFVVDLFNRLLA